MTPDELLETLRGMSAYADYTARLIRDLDAAVYVLSFALAALSDPGTKWYDAAINLHRATAMLGLKEACPPGRE